MLRRAIRGAAPAALLLSMISASTAVARSPVVVAGPARFEVLTPTLIRLEYARDRRFENRRTITTAGQLQLRAPAFSVTRRRGWHTLRPRLTSIRLRLGTGQVTSCYPP